MGPIDPTGAGVPPGKASPTNLHQLATAAGGATPYGYMQFIAPPLAMAGPMAPPGSFEQLEQSKTDLVLRLTRAYALTQRQLNRLQDSHAETSEELKKVFSIGLAAETKASELREQNLRFTKTALALRDQNTQLQHENARLAAAAKDAQAPVEELRREVERLQAEAADARAGQEAARQEAAGLHAELDGARRRRDAAQEEAEHLLVELSAARAGQEAARQEVSQLQTEVANARAGQEAAQEAMAQLRAELDSARGAEEAARLHATQVSTESLGVMQDYNAQRATSNMLSHNLNVARAEIQRLTMALNEMAASCIPHGEQSR